MYPLTCAGGYPMPAKAGKFSIVQVSASVKSLGTAARLTLIDDADLTDNDSVGRILTDDDSYKTTIVDLKATTSEGMIEQVFQEPLRVRKGISIKNADNLQAGSVMVYVR